MNFTQLDMVTLFPPPGTTAGVRVGWVQGDINGTITMNSILTASPPAFTATGTAVIVDTNGDQLFLNVAFISQLRDDLAAQSRIDRFF